MSQGFEQLSAEIAARLERVRGQLTDAEFATLVEDVARTAQRFEQFELRAGTRLTPVPGTLPVRER